MRFQFSAPSLANDRRWYWYSNSGLLPQYVLYRTKEPDQPFPEFDPNGPDGPEELGEVFFDVKIGLPTQKRDLMLSLQPNLLVEDGTAHLATTAFSRCGTYFAYGVSLSGSDFFTIYVRKTSSPYASRPPGGFVNDKGREPDVVRFVKFSSIVWTHDSRGFLYQVRRTPLVPPVLSHLLLW